MTSNIHLESRANDELRLSQIEEVLSDAPRQYPQSSVVVAGDFNLDASKDPTAAARATAGFQDPVVTPRQSTTPSSRLF